MFKLKTVLASAVTAAILATGASVVIASEMKATSTKVVAPVAKVDIIDTAVGAGQFKTLAQAGN